MTKYGLLFAVLLAAAVPSWQLALAAGGEVGPPAQMPGPPEDPDFSAGKAAIEVRNYAAAAESFRKVVAKEPNNANGYNMLAYSYRKAGNLEQALRNYGEALRIDPKHRGAHEYIGEAYLMSGDLQKAEAHLKTLDDLCFFGCEEFTMLKKAVAEYKQKTATR